MTATRAQHRRFDTEPVAVDRATSPHRWRVRQIAAALAAVTSLIYFLIGLQVLAVLDDIGEQTPFGLITGAAFLAGALLILAVDHRVVWTLGGLTQAFIIFTYFDMAAERTPSYEAWGIVIRVLQVGLLVALTYLAMRPKRENAPRG